MSSDARIGTVVAGYRIESLIGRGGMSVVYLAEHAGLQRKAALKLLAPELAENEEFRRRFIRESQLAAGLDHPNVIPVYDAGEVGGLLFIAMRYVRGSDLRKLLDEHGPLDLPDVVRVMSQVGQALDAAHAEGLVHRDVKPANVLLSPATPPARIGHLYLADFGLTKKSLSGSGVTKSGAFVGTLDYVAPEQIRSEPVDGRADVYSAACVLYECLTGRPPFVRDTEVAVMFAHLNDPPPAPTAEREVLPAGINAVVAKAMAKDPDDRYATAGELAEAAHAALMPALGEPLETAPPLPPARRGRGVAVATAGAVATAIVALIVVLATSNHGSRSVAGTPTGGTPSAGGPTSHTSEPSPSAAATTGFRGFVRVNPRTGRVEARARLSVGAVVGPSRVEAIAAEGALWVGDLSAAPVLVELNKETGERESKIPIQNFHAQHIFLAAGDNSIWVLPAGESFGLSDTLRRVDPATAKVVGQFPIGSDTIGMTYGPGGVWVARANGSVAQVAPGANAAVVLEVGDIPTGLASSGGWIWVSSDLGGVVDRIDPSTGKARSFPVPGGLSAIAGDASGLWVLDAGAGTVVRVDPTTGEVGDPIRVGSDPSDIAVGGGSVWVPDRTDGSLYRIDEDTQISTALPLGLGSGATRVAFGQGNVWVLVE